MKTIGILGGMSWESTITYYKIINEEVSRQLGGLHSAKILIASIDFDDVGNITRRNDWAYISEYLQNVAQHLERGGAECLLIATNTMHKLADDILKAIDIPIIHIVDTMGEALDRAEHKKVGLLATRTTMEEDFYRQRIQEKFGIETVIPELIDREKIQTTIYDELCRGKVLPESKVAFIDIIERLKASGITAVILGCTEIQLLVQQSDTDIPLFDATEIHAKSAVKWALQ